MIACQIPAWSAEEHVARYVIREHERGRSLQEILEDKYVQNRLTSEQQKLLQGLTHPVLRESIRDYLINQAFRRDLWVKGLRQRAIADRLGLSQSTVSLICRSFRKP